MLPSFRTRGFQCRGFYRFTQSGKREEYRRSVETTASSPGSRKKETERSTVQSCFFLLLSPNQIRMEMKMKMKGSHLKKKDSHSC